jgi:glycosyltransferase involved in cell wall biosynthesis
MKVLSKDFSSKLHIIHVSSAIEWRGGEQQLIYLYDELCKKGIYQTIICVKDSALEKICRASGKHYLSFVKRSSFDLFFAWQIKKLTARETTALKIIHAHDSHAHTFAILSSLLFRNSWPIIVSRRVDFPIGDNFLSNFKYNYKGVKKIICVSNAIKNMISPKIKNHERLITIYDGISKYEVIKKNKLRYEYHIPADHYLIGNVSALAPHKDYYTFIDTAAILIQKGIKAVFFIIGHGNERENIKKYIGAKNVSDHVIMTGFRNDVKEILPELDILLMTSKTEGLGSSILDAMHCGVAVVATQTGGIPEIVMNEKTGLLAPAGNSQVMAENILKLFTNDELRKSIISNARKQLNQFYADRMADETLNVYEEAFTESSFLPRRNKH